MRARMARKDRPYSAQASDTLSLFVHPGCSHELTTYAVSYGKNSVRSCLDRAATALRELGPLRRAALMGRIATIAITYWDIDAPNGALAWQPLASVDPTCSSAINGGGESHLAMHLGGLPMVQLQHDGVRTPANFRS